MRLPVFLASTIFAAALLSLPNVSQAGFAPQPVTEINTEGDANPTNVAYADDRVYFVASDKKGRSWLYVKTLVKGDKKVEDLALSKPPTKLKLLTSKTGVTSVVDNVVVAPNRQTGKSTVYFHVIGDGLYCTKGSPANTFRLFKWDANSPGVYANPAVTAFQSRQSKGLAGVVFTANKAATGFEPFYTFGTPATTKLLSDIMPGADSSYPYGYCARPSGTFQDQLYFGAQHSIDGYQLFRYKQNQTTNVLELDHFNVARTDLPANLSTLPFGMTLAGNDIVLSAGNHPTDTGRDVCLLDTVAESFFFLSTTNVNPQNFGQGFGSVAYFSGFDPSKNQNRLYVAASAGDFSYTEVYDHTVAGANPRDQKLIGKQNYFIADDGGPNLYRIFSKNDSVKFLTDTNAALFVTEYRDLVDENSGSGRIYIVGHTAGNADTLWYVEVGSGLLDTQAKPVTTTDGHPILSPSHLTPAIHLAGSTSLERLYFSCKGVGTEYEFIKDSKGDPTTTARGEELWALDPR